MHRGVDPAQLSNDFYEYGLNVRFIFNEDGTFAIENTRGTKVVFNLAANYGASTDYKPIGSGYVNGSLIIFSTNSTNSEIGLVRQDQYDTYTYQTIFNDLYDPNGGLMDLSLQFNIRSNPIQENNLIENIYWNDDRNEPRVFNVFAGSAFNYAAPYPTWYSVHGMASMPDLTWGLIKYQQNIDGSLLSGERQYAYRYIHQTGYASPWSYLSEFIFLTADQVGSDWTQYQMTASGVITNKGHRLEIDFLDTRFQKIEVACLYWATNTGAQSASIIFSGNVTGTSITVDHVAESGQAITVDELIKKFLNIKKAKTQSIHYDNYYHMGNLELYGDLQIPTVDITVEPVIKRMISDETVGVTTRPFTNQSPKNTTITKDIFQGGTSNIQETYDVVNDYISYKGTQWTFLHKGYFRRETYPYALVLWNRKGQPLFAQHITDYTFPEQYNDEFADARVTGTTTGTVGAVGDYLPTNFDAGSTYQITDTIQQGNQIVLQIMGVKFGNIRIPKSVAFDANGKLQLSGFSIVRMDRFASIVGQGLLMNTIRTTTGQPNCNDAGNTRPLITAWNYLRFNGANPSTPEIGETPETCIINARGYYHTFECPDFMIDQTILQGGSTLDKFKFIGACVPSFHPTAAPFSDHLFRVSTPPRANYHYYNKNYQTYTNDVYTSITDGVNAIAGGQFGTEWGINELFADARSVSGVAGGTFSEQATIRKYQDMEAENPDDSFTAITHHHSILWEAAINAPTLVTSSITSGEFHNTYYIANYLKPQAGGQVTQVALENRTYFNIGHFIPINATTLAAAYDAVQDDYVFNEVEVWGGDCYLDYFDYCRLVPAYFYENGDHVADCDFYSDHALPDYAIGLIFPVESKFNTAMRFGETFAKVGSQPLSTYCNGVSGFPNGTGANSGGIYYASDDNQREEAFDVNSVLQTRDLISIYNAKKTLLNPDIIDFPLMEVHSLQKFYGEQFDSYRQFLVNNFQFANGAFGEITSFEELLGNLYVLQQNALARIRFNERQLIETTTGTVNTGTGVGYQGHDYISTQYGCQHQFGIVNSTKSIYFPDAEKGKWLRFGQDGVHDLSDSYDARWMQKKLREYWYVKDIEGDQIEATYYDNPSYAGGILGVFDYKNNSVILSFTDRKEANKQGIYTVGVPETVEYNEMTNSFQTYHSFHPRHFLSNKQNYLSLDPDGGNSVFAHDEGIIGNIYGVNRESKLRFISNPTPNLASVFDNNMLEVVGDGVPLISQWTGQTNIVPIQTVVLNNSALDNRPDFREGNLTFPTMQLNQGVRLRGAYLIQEYTIANDGTNKKVRITSNTSKYRISQRS